MPYADLRDANLEDADLTGAKDLIFATVYRVKANSSTTCPNGKKWGTACNDCGFTGPDRPPYQAC